MPSKTPLYFLVIAICQNSPKKKLVTPSLYDATASGMTEALTNNLSESNPYRIGQAIGVNNYGMIALDWENRSLEFSFHDVHGKTLFAYGVNLKN